MFDQLPEYDDYDAPQARIASLVRIVGPTSGAGESLGVELALQPPMASAEALRQRVRIYAAADSGAIRCRSIRFGGRNCSRRTSQ